MPTGVLVASCCLCTPVRPPLAWATGVLASEKRHDKARDVDESDVCVLGTEEFDELVRAAVARFGDEYLQF